MCISSFRALAMVLVSTAVLAPTSTVRAQCRETAWVPGMVTGGPVGAVAVLPGGDVIVGGTFTQIRGGPAGVVQANRIARFSQQAGLWSPLGSGTDQGVLTIEVVPEGGDLIVGGRFVEAGGLAANHIARCNPTTGAWSTLGSGVGGVEFAFVRGVAFLPGGDFMVVGYFSTAGGGAASNIARYNPATNMWSALGAGVNGGLQCIALLPDGDLLVGGTFTMAGDVAAHNIARYNLSTGVWSALGSGADYVVVDIAVLPDGDVVMGGGFRTVGGIAAIGIVRYRPATGVWTSLGTELQFQANALVVLPNGELVAGGAFQTIAGVPANSIAVYNPITGGWSALGAGIQGQVSALALAPNGDVIVGGSFSRAGGVLSDGMGRVSPGVFAPTISSQPIAQAPCGSGTATANFSVTANGTGAQSYAWRKDGVAIDPVNNPSALTRTLVITNVSSADAGSYDCIITNVCGSTTSNAATLLFCIADFNCSGTVSVQDIFTFVTAFFADDPRADVNESGTISVQDVFDFLAAYFARCA